MDASIRLRSDGRVLLGLDVELMRAGIDLAQKKLGHDRVRHMPAHMLDATYLRENDAVFACVAGSRASRHVARLFKLRPPAALPNGGYTITPARNGKGSVVVVVGGDRFGALCGLSELFCWSERAGAVLTYRGGTRKEIPAFPLRFYWTWDHSTNWVLDDPGNQVNGCNNPYLKKPETFLEDYRRLIDHAIDTRFNAVMISGFLRDSHGGESFAHEISRYGADRGVAVLPGIGITSYSGIYYEGEHPANLETFVQRHPASAAQDREGRPSGNLSPYRADSQQYIRDALEWMVKAFPIGGIYMENGDYIVDYSKFAQRARRRIPTGEEDFLKEQYVAYRCALETLHRLCPEAWNIYVTYCGFDRNNADSQLRGLGRETPYFVNHMPKSAICMWTMSGMVRQKPVLLRDWMNNARPAAAYDNPHWPRGLRPPTARSAGFMHQGSQWSGVPRTGLALSTFAEGCLRSWEAGLEGISIHGEASSRSMTWLLNYLAMRHWTYHPESTLKEFAEAELSPRVGGSAAAADFVEALCLLEEPGRHPDARDIASRHIGSGYSWRGPDRSIEKLAPQRMWMELKWWACQPDSWVNMLPRVSDIL